MDARIPWYDHGDGARGACGRPSSCPWETSPAAPARLTTVVTDGLSTCRPRRGARAARVSPNLPGVWGAKSARAYRLLCSTCPPDWWEARRDDVQAHGRGRARGYMTHDAERLPRAVRCRLRAAIVRMALSDQRECRTARSCAARTAGQVLRKHWPRPREILPHRGTLRRTVDPASAKD